MMGKHSRRAAKRDSNEPEIVEALEKIGALVVKINETDKPDLAIVFRGTVYLCELKTRKGKLSEGQSQFIQAADTQNVFVARTLGEVLYNIGAVG